jgi:hypothetical protein
MVSSIGKNVFKYAETSVHRLGASLPTRMDDEDLLSFARLAAELCEKCQVSSLLPTSLLRLLTALQILDRWTVEAQSELESLTQTTGTNIDSHAHQHHHHHQQRKHHIEV